MYNKLMSLLVIQYKELQIVSDVFYTNIVEYSNVFT